MRKLLFAVVMVVAVAVAGVAYAQDASDVVTVKSTAPAGGSKSKPKPVAPSYDATIQGAGGMRAKTPAKHNFSWTGIREMGKYFPTCSADKIDAVQSDAVCPKGSLVATGSIEAKVGPEGVLSQNFVCHKQIRYYNAGGGKMALYSYGPGSDCAGIDYLPPIAVKWATKGNTSQQQLVFPQNITHPFPGMEGGFSQLHVKFTNLTKSVKLPGAKKKSKIGYLTSFGCSGARKFTLTAIPEAGAINSQSVAAGRC